MFQRDTKIIFSFLRQPKKALNISQLKQGTIKENHFFLVDHHSYFYCR